jgi:hypothetical protein
MYFATNIAAIQTAMEAKTPRAVVDVIREYYPDCTIDRNGRAHAPYDGYLCVHTDRLFRGGEYLPFELTEETQGSKVYNLWVYCDGEVYTIEGTKGQIKAGAEIAKDQTFEFDKTISHVGDLGKRCAFDLTLIAVFANVGMYGPEYTNMLRDSEGNPVVYKGSKPLDCATGEKISLVGMVKSHWTSYNGEKKCTYINRPKKMVK